MMFEAVYIAYYESNPCPPDLKLRCSSNPNVCDFRETMQLCSELTADEYRAVARQKKFIPFEFDSDLV
jgi:hypothetical protein